MKAENHFLKYGFRLTFAFYIFNFAFSLHNSIHGVGSLANERLISVSA